MTILITPFAIEVHFSQETLPFQICFVSLWTAVVYHMLVDRLTLIQKHTPLM